MLYRDEILDHYKHPHNFGEMTGATHTSKGANPSCGDSIQLYLKISNNVIEDVKFVGEGCALSTASASILTDILKGKSLEEAKKITQENLLELIGDVNPGRLKCVLLPFSALEYALRVK